MLRKILVALDGSASSAAVFDQALAIAQGMNAELMVLHVLMTDEEGYPLISLLETTHNPAEIQKHWQAYQAQWEARLRTYTQQATDQGIKAEWTQSYGNPGHVICDWARTWDADLIVLGRQGQNTLPGWMLGSVSTYVSQQAPCSVMMTPVQPTSNPAPLLDREWVEMT